MSDPIQPYTEQDKLFIDTIRTLSIDAVQAANSGHPGAPMSLAPAAYLPFKRIMKCNPLDPAWPDRDRFVLSAGHASMLLYSSLFLAGYDLELEDIKQFRQMGSKTPGHPEFRHTAGVETTTGPLGQGFANAVGMAIAERWLRERYGREVCDHRIFTICSDGDLMEGISAEAASIAGHLGLGHLIYLYDDNSITIDGSTDLSFTEDIDMRFRAQGWQTLTVADGEDCEAIEAAIREGIAEENKPTLIRLKTVIAHHSPNKRGTHAAHGAALGEDEVRATKELLGWDPDKHFHVPEEVALDFQAFCRTRGVNEQMEWQTRYDAWAMKNPQLHNEWFSGLIAQIPPGLDDVMPKYEPATTPKMSTRVAGREAMQAVGKYVPNLIGGAADLAGSTYTNFNGEPSYTKEKAGRNIHWGIREHGMAAAVNGIALHGGLFKPYGSTFFVFADYMRPSIRLSALMNLDVTWVFTHDSVAVGEDGPTHEPIEHLASLRAIPGLVVLRPADATETVEAWRLAVEDLRGPVVLVLTRQDLPVLDRTKVTPVREMVRGAYTLIESDDPENPAAIIVATGSEVALAIEARELLAAKGTSVRVVSMPSWEMYGIQPQEYKDMVLTPGVPKISVEAGSSFGWSKFVDRSVSIDTFGASGPAGEVLAHFGMTAENVVKNVEAAIAGK